MGRLRGKHCQADDEPRAAPDGRSCSRFRLRSRWNSSVGHRRLSTRPRHHAQAQGAIETFKKLPARLDAIGRAQGVRRGGGEVWFADEACVGQKNKITRRWARRGTRTSAPQDQRTASTYIFGAICPETGAAVGVVLLWCNTEAMGLHLAEIAARVTPGRHCALLVDQAGWHISERLLVPGNITIVKLPPKSLRLYSSDAAHRRNLDRLRPELNPVENVWQFLRNNWLSNRVFASYDAIVDHCCDAWNRLVDQRWRVMSIGLSDWANDQRT